MRYEKYGKIGDIVVVKGTPTLVAVKPSRTKGRVKYEYVLERGEHLFVFQVKHPLGKSEVVVFTGKVKAHSDADGATFLSRCRVA